MRSSTVKCLNPMCPWKEQDRTVRQLEQAGDGLYRVIRIVCECGSDVWANESVRDQLATIRDSKK